MDPVRPIVKLVGAMALAATLLTTACGGGGSDASGDGGGGGGDGEPAAEQATTTTAAPRSFTIAATGDILVHAPVQADASRNAGGKGYNFDPMFDEVRDTIKGADLSICHQETPISADGKNLTVPKTLSFNAPKEIATALKNAGFDACDTASNHTYDRNASGVKQTLDMLEQAGIKGYGGSRSQEEADNPPIIDVKGVKVGLLAFSYTIYNNAGPNQQVPPDTPWLKTMLWPAQGKDGMLAQAQKLKDRGAEFVVVSMHWGDQYITKPNADQRQLAKDLLGSPNVDLILGDHVHVVQPCEKIGDKYVMYGMGNFLSNQSPTQDRSLKIDSQDGSLETYTINEVSPGTFRVTKMQYMPTWVVTQGHKVVPATPDKYKDSYNRTVKAVTSLGPGACDATPAF
jgi:poly-gamma-glutamate capsule biosynthesis protein CapA/YwtB (metallophosphatase superfamily)